MSWGNSMPAMMYPASMMMYHVDNGMMGGSVNMHADLANLQQQQQPALSANEIAAGTADATFDTTQDAQLSALPSIPAATASFVSASAIGIGALSDPFENLEPPSGLGAPANNELLGNPSASTATEEMHRSLKEAAAKEVQKMIEEENKQSKRKAGGKEGGKGKRGKIDLDAEEKARQNRERNRAHARSTRLRKKAYVSLLSTEVAKLTQEREYREQQVKVMQQMAEEDLKVRKFVLRSFLGFHANGETDVAKWCALVSPDFTLTQPITPFRSFDRHQTMFTGNIRVVRGTEDLVEDAVSLNVMLQNLGVHNPRWLHKKLNIFSADSPDFIDRLKEERVAIGALGEKVGVNKLQVFNESNNSKETSRKKAVTEGKGSTDSDDARSSKSSLAALGDNEMSPNPDTTSTTSSSSISQHDYNAPSIPDPAATGIKRKAAHMTAEVVSVTESSESTGNSSQPPNGAGTQSLHPSLPPPKTSVSQAPPPLPTRNTLENRLSRAPIVQGFQGFQGLGKKVGIPQVHSKAPLSSDDATRDGTLSNTSSGNDGSGSDISGESESNSKGSRNGVATVANSSASGTSVPLSSNGPSSPASALPTAHTTSIKNSTPSIGQTKDECTARGEIVAEYTVDDSDFFCCAEGFMCKWTLRSLNAEELGATTELEVQGMAKCTFDKNQRLSNVDLMYDVMSVMQQLKYLDDAPDDNSAGNHMVPNTLDMALSISPEPRLICTLSHPHQITHVNETWMKLWDLTHTECEGKTLLEMLTIHYNIDDDRNRNAKLERRSLKRLQEMIAQAHKNRACCSTILHYKRGGWTTVTFVNFVPMPDKKYGANYFLVVGRQLNRDRVMENFEALEKLME